MNTAFRQRGIDSAHKKVISSRRLQRAHGLILPQRGDQPSEDQAQRTSPQAPINSETVMSDTALATVQQTRQQLAAQGRSNPGKVTGRLKVALDAMIWQGMKRGDAAELAGLKEQSLYVALARPHVRAWYLKQLEVLRTSGKSRRIFRLEQLSEQDDNKQAAINAIRALDQLEDEAHVRANAVSQSSPGFVIMVVDQRAAVNGKPLIEHESSERE